MSNVFDYIPKFDDYRSLMPNRIREILLVSNLYDAFVLEEDGSLSEQIWSQYVGMRLTDPPNVQRVSTVPRALEVVKKGRLDMVLVMTRLSEGDPFAFARKAKQILPDLPIVLLATDPSELKTLPPFHERKDIDNIFLWNNDAEILLAIIKLMEDKFNVDPDTANGKVRVILLMEDAIIHYSSFLPIMYRVIMKLTRNLIDDGFNDLHKQLRMRSRAKVLLADSYEEGIELYNKYKKNMLGVISDVRYFRNGKKDPDAGFDFVKAIRNDSPDLPVMLHSSEPMLNQNRAYSIGADFLDKNSPSLLIDLRTFLEERMGFGDFVFRLPNGVEVDRSTNTYELMETIQKVPIESLIWHAERNHFSNWLMARTEINIAESMKYRKVDQYSSLEAVRRDIIQLISDGLADKQRDVVAKFSIKRSSKNVGFMHLGEGSLGGKGRGIAFVRYILKRFNIKETFPTIDIDVPTTLVLGAGEFEHFLKVNQLKRFAIECDDINEIRSRFLSARIRPELYVSLRHYLKRTSQPLAIRSSSILEDSHLQPFAGLYATYMIPNNSQSETERLAQLLAVIKMVWASTYGRNPKSYFKATSHRIESEQMAVIVQEVVGKQHANYFYPTFSGVGQSHNFYPYGPMEPEDGVSHIAVGLGKMVVDGGSVVRFSPQYPQVLPQFSSPKDWLDMSQRQYFALNLSPSKIPVWKKDYDGLELVELSQAEKDNELDLIGSVYCPADNIIRDSLSYNGPRLATFSGILKYNEFPLADILANVFEIFQSAMGCPIEMEYAVNLWNSPKKNEFKILQLRPLIANAEHGEVAISNNECDNSWIRTNMALGNGIRKDIADIIFIDPDRFDKMYMNEIKNEIDELNQKMESLNRNYMLIGFGRWGSSDPYLGIGVGWAQISKAAVMVEASLEDFRIDPSNGAHFFQNITSLGIGYLTMQYGNKDAVIDWKWLRSQKIIEKKTFATHIQLEKPTIIKIDGRTSSAVGVKP